MFFLLIAKRAWVVVFFCIYRKLKLDFLFGNNTTFEILQETFQPIFRLMRPESKRWKGNPFKLVKMLPVDMFPYSRQCELVLLFERDTKTVDTSD